eukprot:gb/GECG01016372.1/.p1 GENE.gb/GECG01016372.1/~~gb/GECG01016372.1/.p1  ORF type:complete len:118 (+),score=7.14 gb/GECG01016372.1/:1-354(+)
MTELYEKLRKIATRDIVFRPQEDKDQADKGLDLWRNRKSNTHNRRYRIRAALLMNCMGLRSPMDVHPLGTERCCNTCLCASERTLDPATGECEVREYVSMLSFFKDLQCSSCVTTAL